MVDVTDYRDLFIQGAKALMIADGFTFSEIAGNDQNAIVVALAKDGENAFVVASEREIRMNSDDKRMANLVAARVKNAVLTWKNNKAHPVNG